MSSAVCSPYTWTDRALPDSDKLQDEDYEAYLETILGTARATKQLILPNLAGAILDTGGTGGERIGGG